MMRQVSTVLDDVLRDPTETGEEGEKALGTKRTALRAMVFTILAGVVMGINASGLLGDEDGSWLNIGMIVWVVGSTLTAAICMCLTKKLGPYLATLWIFPFGIAALGTDWASAGLVDSWTLVIVCMDGLLSFGAPPCVSHVVLALTVMYLTVRGWQNGTDFGFWEVVGTERYMAHVCPPIGRELGFSSILLQCFVCVIDYVMTRGFVDATEAQVEVMRASQAMASTIASLLSRYEVEECQELIEGPRGAALPTGLRDAYSLLLSNLQSYKPYLPQSCLPDASASEEEGSTSATSSSCSAPFRQSDAHDRSPRQSRGSAASASTVSCGSQGSGGGPHLDASGALAHASAAQHPKRQGGAVRAAPTTAKVSCLCVNRCGFLSWAAGQGPTKVQNLIDADVARFGELSAQNRGVVDSINGDHLRSSFNAARSCATHSVSAARCASDYAAHKVPPSLRCPSIRPRASAVPTDGFLPPRQHTNIGHSGSLLPITGAVCSGACLRGDFGSATIVRFMLIGGPISLVHPVERLAAAWEAEVLVDQATQADLAASWSCRLRGAATFSKLRGREYLLWEAMGERSSAGGPEEWMYELSRLPADRWAPHAAAFKLWLDGDAAGCAARAEEAMAEATGDVRDALELMAAGSGAGLPAPRYVLSMGGGTEIRVAGGTPTPTPADIPAPRLAFT